MNTATYRGSRRDLQWFLGRLNLILAGKVVDPTNGGVKALLTRLGMVALSIIRDAYVVKARGGTDASGLKWPALSPRTIAYSRRHPGLRRDTAGTQRPSSMLTSGERAHWWSLYKSRLGWYKGDKSHAAASAWVSLKAQGAKTILSVYGQTPVEILRDTGRLINSLSPGIRTMRVKLDGKTVTWSKTDQIFNVGVNSVTVGTSVKYAAKHHWGDPAKGLPQRRLWPDWSEWPDEWKDQIYLEMRDGIADLILRWLGGNRRR